MHCVSWSAVENWSDHHKNVTNITPAHAYLVRSLCVSWGNEINIQRIDSAKNAYSHQPG